MRIRLYALVALTMVSVIITSCSKMEDFDTLLLDVNGVPYLSEGGISDDTFINEVMGYGWKSVSENLIRENGKVEKEDYYVKNQISGYARPHLYFETPSQLTLFFSYDLTKYGYSMYKYFFSKSDIIFHDITRTSFDFRILSVSDKELIAIKNHYTYYTLSRYERMSDETLEEYRENYTYLVNDFR